MHTRSASLFFAVIAAALITSGRTDAAEPVVCLSGNHPTMRNAKLDGARYRLVWAGTTQVNAPGDPRQREWIPFRSGSLTNGRTDTVLANVNIWTETNRYTNYSFSKNNYGIEVNLGRVCRITGFELIGTQERIIFHAFDPDAGRWLPLAEGKDNVELTGLATDRFRVDIHGIRAPNTATFSEFRVFGQMLEATAKQKLPPPPPPAADAATPAGPLAFKPAPVARRAPDPFVFPQPVQMEFQPDRMIALPLGASVVLPDDADAELRTIAENWIELVNRMYYLDLRLTTAAEASAPTIFLGLHDSGGPCADLTQQRKIKPGDIPAEGYAIEITDQRIVLVGVDHDGAQWATKSLLFLFKPQLEGGAKLPLGFVRDYPRSPYRYAFGYPGWRGAFKAGLFKAMTAIKTNYTNLSFDARVDEMADRERVYRTYAGQMFPGSRCGTEGDMLEIKPGGKRNDLDIRRLSACPLHTNYWPGMLHSFPAERYAGGRRDMVDIGYDEIFHNPFGICARCRSAGSTPLELLGDAYMKAYGYLRHLNYRIAIYATGYQKVTSAFDFLEQVPTEGVHVFNYVRPEQNRALKKLGFTVIAGRDGGLVSVGPDDGITSGIIWNWGSGSRAEMMSRYVPLMLMQAEENWSAFDRKVDQKSPEWDARRNRILDIARHMIDYEPIEPEGMQRTRFTVDMAKHANRRLVDEKYGDGKDWLDQGPGHDLRRLPQGRQMLGGIPFDIGDSAVVVAGPGAADTCWDEEVAGIPVNRKASKLYFLHTCSRPIWQSLGRQVVLVGLYRVRYDDGTFVTTEVNYSQHVQEWDRRMGYREMEHEPVGEPCADASVAWRGLTDGGRDVTLYNMSWSNPYPDKTIVAIDVLPSAITETNGNHLAVIAISGQDVHPMDIRAAEARPFKPDPRPYYPRKRIPADVERMDLTRLTMPPANVNASATASLEWETSDRWIKARVDRATAEKSDLNFGVYSALHPDDEAWRCASSPGDGIAQGTGTLELTLKQAIPLRGLGIKGLLQNIRSPGLYPTDFRVHVQTEDRQWQRVATVSGHVGPEGEHRIIFDQPIAAVGVKIEILQGLGLSSVNLYVTKGSVPEPRFMSGPSLDPTAKPRSKNLDELVDELEGL